MITIFFILSMFIASFYQGITGFGFSLIASPLAMIFLDKGALVSSLVLVGIFLNLILLIKIKNKINKNIFYPLLFSTLIGMPIGLIFLKLIPLSYFKIISGSLSMIFALLFFCFKIKFKKNNIYTLIAGFIAGILQTSTTMNGPPIVLYLLATGISKNKFIKTLATIFLIMNIVSLPIFLLGRVLDFKGIFLGIISFPFVAFAGILGNKISKLIPEKIFILLALSTVFIIGLTALISGLKIL